MREDELTRVAQKLKAVLGPKALVALARSTKFVVRRRTITPEFFVPSLLKSLGSRRVESIADLVRDFNYDHQESVCYKPYYEKLDAPSFPKLMRSMFEAMLRTMSLRMLKPLRKGPLARFRDILIQDGSSFALHDALVYAFPGRFTKVSPAAAELHVTFSLLSDNGIYAEVAGDSECERHFLPPADCLRDTLILGDRGYDSTDYMREVEEAGGCFLIRVRKSLDPIVARIHKRGAFYRGLEGKYLSQVLRRLSKKEHVDLDVEWRSKVGRIEWAARVVARWNTRDRQWVRLMTNLSLDDFSTEDVFRVYRLRWQIELLFKELKSYANLHKFITIKPDIAEGLIWAALCTLLLKRFLTHACEHVFGSSAISTRRVAMCAHMFLAELCAGLLAGLSALRRILRRALSFLFSNARRSNPRREKLRGRLAFGLGRVVGAK